MDFALLAQALQHSLLKCLSLGFATVLVIAIYHEYLRLKSRVKGLPGPRGYPIVGNLFQIKGKPAYENYRKWAKEYGPVFQGKLKAPPPHTLENSRAVRVSSDETALLTSAIG